MHLLGPVSSFKRMELKQYLNILAAHEQFPFFEYLFFTSEVSKNKEYLRDLKLRKRNKPYILYNASRVEPTENL